MLSSLAAFTWNPDPVIFSLGPVAIRWYSVMFVASIYIGYRFWTKQVLRGGYDRSYADDFLIWAVIAVIAGARLGHVFFYHPMKYLTRPWLILFIWRGGLASHGATVGIVLALYFYSGAKKKPRLDTGDRFAFSAAVGATGVRIGNFLNSEIVGRPTDVPWAFRFPRYEEVPVPRHPSQLYEVALGLTVLGLLHLIDAKLGREDRPRGVLIGSFLILYFFGRFMVEFFKEYHTLESSYLTMGQYLSIVPFLGGIGLVWYGWKHPNVPTRR